MKIKTNELLKKVEVLKQLYQDSDFSGISKYLYFKDNKIYSYNGRIFLQTDFEFDNNSFSISTMEFYKVLEKIKLEEIELEKQENKLILLGNNVKIEFCILENNKEFEMNDNFIKLPNDFINGIKLCKFCVNTKATDGSAYLTIENNNMYATDKYRICSYKLDETNGKILLPHDCLEILIKLNVNQYSELDNKYYFKGDNFIVGIIKSDVERKEFEKYENIFNSENEIKIKLPIDIKQNIELSEIFTDDNDIFNKQIKFIIENKKLICKSENEKGLVESKIDIDTDLNLSFSIHPLFLLEILSICDRMEINGDICIFKNEKFCYFFRISR